MSNFEGGYQSDIDFGSAEARTSDVMYFVATTGNDATAEKGNRSKPWKTIQAAYTAASTDPSPTYRYVLIADGTYMENITLDNDLVRLKAEIYHGEIWVDNPSWDYDYIKGWADTNLKGVYVQGNLTLQPNMGSCRHQIRGINCENVFIEGDMHMAKLENMYIHQKLSDENSTESETGGFYKDVHAAQFFSASGGPFSFIGTLEKCMGHSPGSFKGYNFGEFNGYANKVKTLTGEAFGGAGSFSGGTIKNFTVGQKCFAYGGYWYGILEDGKMGNYSGGCGILGVAPGEFSGRADRVVYDSQCFANEGSFYGIAKDCRFDQQATPVGSFGTGAQGEFYGLVENTMVSGENFGAGGSYAGGTIKNCSMDIYYSITGTITPFTGVLIDCNIEVNNAVSCIVVASTATIYRCVFRQNHTGKCIEAYGGAANIRMTHSASNKAPGVGITNLIALAYNVVDSDINF